MNETPAMIQQQMDETKMRLTRKLELLESQFSETVQSTGTAVNATVEAVQEAAHIVSYVRRYVDKHPWLALGGSIALGYFAVKLCKKPPMNSPQPPQAEAPSVSHSQRSDFAEAKPAVDAVAIVQAIKAASLSDQQISSRQQLNDRAISALIGVAQDVAHQAVPVIMDYLTTKSDKSQSQPLCQQPDLDQWNGAVREHEPLRAKPPKSVASNPR